jgi:hypothetical protein
LFSIPSSDSIPYSRALPMETLSMKLIKYIHTCQQFPSQRTIKNVLTTA